MKYYFTFESFFKVECIECLITWTKSQSMVYESNSLCADILQADEIMILVLLFPQGNGIFQAPNVWAKIGARTLLIKNSSLWFLS